MDIACNKCLALQQQFVFSNCNQSLQQFGVLSPSSDVVNAHREYLMERNKTWHNKNPIWSKERDILTPKNNTIANIYVSLLEHLPTEKVQYQSVYSVVELVDHYPAEFLHFKPHQKFHLTIRV